MLSSDRSINDPFVSNKELVSQISIRSFQSLLSINDLLNIILTNRTKYIYSITQNDIEAFKLIIDYSNSSLMVKSIDYLYTSKYNLTVNNDDKVFITKLFLMTTWLSSFSFEFRIDSAELMLIIMRTLKKMFIEQLLHEEHMLIIIKASLIHSLFDKEMVYYDISHIQSNKSIRNINTIWSIINLLSSFSTLYNEQLAPDRTIKEYNEILSQTITFADSLYLTNYNNINALSETNTMLTSLMDIMKTDYAYDSTKELIIKFLTKIYLFNWQLEWMYQSIDAIFMDTTNVISSVRYISSQMKFIKAQISEEDNHLINHDSIIIKKGFYHNATSDSGISSSLISFPHEGYSIVVSFKLIPYQYRNNKTAYTIFSLNDQFILSIIGTRLIISSEDRKANELFDIDYNKAYVLWIFQRGTDALFYLNDKLAINNARYPQGKIEVNIGQKPIIDESEMVNVQYADFFTGEIGTFILFDQDFRTECSNLIALKDDYESLVFIHYNQDFYLEKLPKEVLSAFQSRDSLMKNIRLVISSQSIFKFNQMFKAKSLKKTYLKYNSFYFEYEPDCNQPTFQMKTPMNQSKPDQCCYAFEKRICIIEMIRNNGIMFLELIVAYLINHYEAIDPALTINCLESIIDVCMLIIKFIGDNGYNNDNQNDIAIILNREIKNLFLSFEQLIGLLYSKGFKFNLSLLCSFSNYFENLLKTKLLFEHSDLFLNYDYYDDGALMCLFAFIAKYINCFPQEFYTEPFYNCLLKFAQIYQSNYHKNVKKSYSELFRKYISFSLRQQHLEYKCVIHYLIHTITSIRLIPNGYQQELYLDYNSDHINSGKDNSGSNSNDNGKDNEQNSKPNDSFSIIMTYKYLKLLYTSIQNKGDYSNLIAIIQSDYINSSEEAGTLKAKLSSFLTNCFDYVDDYKFHDALNSIDVKRIEIIKSLCIRLLDDLFYRNQYQKTFSCPKPIMRNNKSINTLSVISTKNAIKESNPLIRTVLPFIELFSPSEYTLRAFCLMLFTVDKSNRFKLKFLKDGTVFQPLLSPYFKDPLFELIKLFERLAWSNGSDSNQQQLLLFTLYDLLYGFIQQINKKYSSLTREERSLIGEFKNDIVLMNKACFKIYIAWFNSNSEGNSSSTATENPIQRKIENDILEIIKLTLGYTSSAPFYFDLLLKLYLKYDREDYCLKGIKYIIAIINNETSSIIIKINQKNLIVLLYSIICFNPKRDFLFKNTAFIKDIIIFFTNLLHNSNIVYLKSLFPIELNWNGCIDKDKEKETVGNKMIIDLLFEIYFEFLKEKGQYEGIKGEIFEFLILEMLMKKQIGIHKAKKKNTMCYIIDKEANRQMKQKALKEQEKEIKALRQYLSNRGIVEYEGSVTLYFLIKILIHLQIIEKRYPSHEVMKTNLIVIASQLFIETNKFYIRKKLSAKSSLSSSTGHHKEIGLYSAFIFFIQSNHFSPESKAFPIEKMYQVINSASNEDKIFFTRISSDVLFKIKQQTREVRENNLLSIILANENSITFSRNSLPFYQFQSRSSLNDKAKAMPIPKTKSSFDLVKETNMINMRTTPYSTRHSHSNQTLNAFRSFNDNHHCIDQSDKNSSTSNCKMQLPWVNRRYSFKNSFLKQTFSVYFSKVLLYDPLFNQMSNIYCDSYANDIPNDIKRGILNYPTKLKNMTCKNYSKVFFERDYKFWDRPTLKYSHPYLFNNKSKAIMLFDKKLTLPKLNNKLKQQLDRDNNSNGIEFYSELITISGVYFGRIIICQNCACFLSNQSAQDLRNDKDTLDFALCSLENDWIKTKNKSLIIFYEDIDEVINRRFVYKWIAMEFFLKDGRSYLFNLFSEDRQRRAFDCLKQFHINTIEHCKDYFIEKKYTEKWANNDLSTYDYLLLLNKFSSRSYNDFNQYPVFPWAIRSNKENRDFSYPMSLQSKAKRAEYHQMDLFHLNGFQKEHGSHYSTAAFCFFYLMRVNPFSVNMIKFQRNKFDNPNRQFSKLNEILNVCEVFKDNREPIPELFSSPDFFINFNCNDFGIQAIEDCNNVIIGHRRVHDVLFDPYASNSIEFAYTMKALMNTDFQLNQKINEWINFVFGHMQYLNNDLESYTKFSQFSYEQLIDFNEMINQGRKLKKSKSVILEDIRNKISCILNLGQCPYVLFNVNHPKKRITQSNDLDIQFDSRQITLKQKDPHHQLHPVNYYSYFCSSCNKSRFYCLTHQRKFEVYDSKSLEKKTVLNLGYFKYLTKIDKQMHLYKPKYIFCELTDLNLIFARYLDNSIKLFLSNSKVEVRLESFVTAIIRINDNEFMTGHETGEVYHWLIKADPIFSMRLIKKILSNPCGITALLFDNKINVVITSDKDCVIIRNSYNFDYITRIEPRKDCKRKGIMTVIDIKMSHYDLLYVMIYYSDENGNENEDSHHWYIIMGYSLNGIYFGCIEGCFTNFDFASNGNLICGYWRENVIRIFNCVTFAQLYQKSIKGVKIGDDSIYSFNYEPLNMIIYYCSSNSEGSVIKRIKIDSPNEIQYFC